MRTRVCAGFILAILCLSLLSPILVNIAKAGNEYTITVTQTNHGTITPGTTIVNVGGNQIFIVTPDNGYFIESITTNAGPLLVNSSSGQTIEFNNVHSNGSLTATYAPNQFAISVIQAANGNIAPGTSIVDYGATPSFSIMPAVGYHIASITVNGQSVAVTSPSGQVYQFSAVSADGSLTATYATNTYTITPSAGVNGAISPNAAQTVDYGATPSFTVMADAQYHILDVEVDGSSVLGQLINGVYTFPAVSANHAIAATFAIDTFDTFIIEASAGAGGSISPSGSVGVNYDGSQTFTVTPDTGYHVVSVLMDGSPAGAPYTFSNVIANGHTISATFAIDAFTLTVTQFDHGTIDPGTSVVNYGATPSFSIMPAVGYHIASITVNGQSVAVTSPSGQVYQFSAVSADGSLTATYANKTYTIDVIQSAKGQISPATSNPNYGDIPIFSITPETGYHIASITVNGQSVAVTSPSGQSYQFGAVHENNAISATFTQNSYTLIMKTVGQGSVSPGNHTYIFGTVANLLAMPSAGWSFSGWSGDASGSAKTVITLNGDKIVTATFTQDAKPPPTPSSTSPPMSTWTPNPTPTETPSTSSTIAPTSTPISPSSMSLNVPVIVAIIAIGVVLVGLLMKRRRRSRIVLLS